MDNIAIKNWKLEMKLKREYALSDRLWELLDKYDGNLPTATLKARCEFNGTPLEWDYFGSKLIGWEFTLTKQGHQYYVYAGYGAFTEEPYFQVIEKAA